MEKEQRENVVPSTMYIIHGLIFVSSPSFIRRFSWQERDYGGTIVSSACFVCGPVDSLLLLVDEPHPCLQLLFTARDVYIVSRVFTSGQSAQHFQYLAHLQILVRFFISFFFEIFYMSLLHY